jgi:high affinity cGMP-specific 3',5'-cyclic phosphodiesterase 9
MTAHTYQTLVLNDKLPLEMYYRTVLKSFNEIGQPMAVSEFWLACLVTEFFNQGNHENLTSLALMGRDNFNQPNSQIDFISFLLLPLADSLSSRF